MRKTFLLAFLLCIPFVIASFPGKCILTSEYDCRGYDAVYEKHRYGNVSLLIHTEEPITELTAVFKKGNCTLTTENSHEFTGTNCPFEEKLSTSRATIFNNKTHIGDVWLPVREHPSLTWSCRTHMTCPFWYILILIPGFVVFCCFFYAQKNNWTKEQFRTLTIVSIILMAYFILLYWFGTMTP